MSFDALLERYSDPYREQILRVLNLISAEDLPLFRNPVHVEDGPDPRTLRRVVEVLKVTDAEAVLLLARTIDLLIAKGRDQGTLPNPD